MAGEITDHNGIVLDPDSKAYALRVRELSTAFRPKPETTSADNLAAREEADGPEWVFTDPAATY